MANHVVGLGKRLVESTNHGATKDMGAASRSARMYSHLTPSSRAQSSVSDNRTSKGPGLGTDSQTRAISSHNDIDRFTRGISEKHPYKPGKGGKSAFDQTKRHLQMTDTRKMSSFTTPTGGTGSMASRKVADVMRPDRYNDPMVENKTNPIGKGENPSGNKGGIRAAMNAMRKGQK